MATITKEMILKFTHNEEDNSYNKIVTDLHGNILIEELHQVYPDSEDMYEEFFDAWEIMLKQIPVLNITKVERFI
jgi:hypothetical protein